MIEAKYFSAAKQELCLSAAEEFFQADRKSLFHRFMPAEGGGEAVLLAIKLGEQGLAQVENMDAVFKLSFNDQGVMLELFPAQGSGKALDADRFAAYLRCKGLQNTDKALLEKLLERAWGHALIAPAQEEQIVDEHVLVTVDDNEQNAFIKIMPGDAGGKPLDTDTVRQYLTEAGVTHGVDEEALQRLVDERILYKSYTVASLIPPQAGADAYLQFHFRREFSGRPKEDDAGRVDYRTLDLFESVSKGQTLVTRIPAMPGIPGYTVKGRELAAEAGKNVAMPTGKNISISDDGNTMTAAAGGMVVYSGNSVNVSNVYNISGNADMKVGNIDFDGSVIIGGTVIPGLTIKASGNIEVGGVVEGSTLIAGGNIMLHRGMQGMHRGTLKAGGNITANYIERTTVLAGNNITANTISHSTVEAGNNLYLSGRNGSLLGGSARVSNMLSAQVLGSAMEMTTEIEVGLVPHKRERISFLQLELKRLPMEIEKLATIANYLERNPSDDIKKVSMRFTVNQSLQHNTQLLAEYTEELEHLLEESANAIHGKVHVSNTAYPGVRLTIASAVYKVERVSEHCSFHVVNGEVSLGIYEG